MSKSPAKHLPDHSSRLTGNVAHVKGPQYQAFVLPSHFRGIAGHHGLMAGNRRPEGFGKFAAISVAV